MPKTQIEDEDENFDGRVLKDKHSYRVPLRFCDSLSRAVAKDATKQHLTDELGNAGLALNRPGYRQLTGGAPKTQAAWDSINRITADAYALDAHWKANAYKDEENNDDLLEARKEGIRSGLSRAGGDDDDIEVYLDGCDDDAILHSNPDEHRQAFVARSRGKDGTTKAVDRAYADYSREIQNAWRRG